MKALDPKSLQKIGFISKLFGYKGELVLIVEANYSDNLLDQEFFFLEFDGAPVPFAIESVREKSNDLLVKFESIDNETAARRLLRKQVFAQNQESFEAANWTWQDVLGFEVEDTRFGSLGNILEVQEFPMQMIAKCIVGEKEVLFPLNDHVVQEIDDENRKILVELPDGLLDIYLQNKAE